MKRSVLFTAAGIVAGVFGCSAAASEEANTGHADLDAAAAEALRSPGSPRDSIPSSLGGIETWTVYMGTGVTVVGTNASGRVEAAITWQRDRGKTMEVVACATARTIECADAASAIARDFHATAGGSVSVAPASLKPLDVDPQKGCVDTVAQYAELVSFPPVSAIVCKSGPLLTSTALDETVSVMDYQFDPCLVQSDGTWDETRKSLTFHEMTIPDLAQTCCGGWSSEDELPALEQGKLIHTQPVWLLCHEAERP